MQFARVILSISAACLATLLAGCFSGTPAAPGVLPQSTGNSVALPQVRLKVREGAMQPSAFVDVKGIEALGKDVLALSDADADTVYILGTRGGFYAALTSGLNEPQGLALDTEGTLYVANTNDSQVLAYPKPYTGQPLTLTDSGQDPAGVAVASDGTVGVTNIASMSSGAGSVSIYAKGATAPCAAVSNGSFARIYFDAFDKSGNLYVDGTDSSGHFVVGEVIGECGATTISPLSIRNKIGSPGGVAVLTNGDIALGDQAGPNVTSIVYTYRPPAHGSLGAPTKTTTLNAVYDGVDFAFNPSDHSLWIADAEAEDFAEYTYPAGVGITAYPNFELPSGVAAYPPQL